MTKEQSIRKRGIIASRAKLEKAMSAAGIATQVALAQQIASNEQSDLVPKDMVSRAFRQLPVDPKSLQRIATALDVPVYTLYLSSDEVDSNTSIAGSTHKEPDNYNGSDTGVSVTQHASKKRFLFLAVPIFLVFLIVLPMLFYQQAENDNESKSRYIEPSFIIVFDNPADHKLAEQIQKQINVRYTSTIISESDLDKKNKFELIRQYQSDGMIQVTTKSVARYTLVEIRFMLSQTEILLSHKFYETSFLQHQTETVADVISELITEKVTSQDIQSDITQEMINAWSLLLEARQLIDENSINANQEVIENKLLSALIQQPDFPGAHAALCELYRLKSWLEDEKFNLEQAEVHCLRALELSPENSYNLAMNAELAVLTGAYDIAQNYYDFMLKNWPDDPLALTGIARSNIRQYEQDNKNIELVAESIPLIEKALLIDQQYFLIYDTLGLLHFYLDNNPASQSAYLQAAKLNNNPVSIVNVAVSMMCGDNLASARTALEELRTLHPESHLGFIYGATLAYYLRDFTDARQLIIDGIDKLGDDKNIHQYWATLGDISLELQNHDEAISAYSRALEAIKFYQLRDMDGDWETIAEQQYTQVVNTLNGESFALSNHFNLEKYSNPADYSSGVNLRLALLKLSQSSKVDSKAHFDVAANSCSLYKYHPVLGVAPSI